MAHISSYSFLFLKINFSGREIEIATMLIIARFLRVFFDCSPTAVHMPFNSPRLVNVNIVI